MKSSAKRGGLLQLVDRIVGALEELEERYGPAESLDVLPRVVQQRIRLRFPRRCPGGELSNPGLRVGRSDPLEGLTQRHCEVVTESDMSRCGIENAEPFVLEVAAQLGLDLIRDYAARPLLAQSLRREPHGFLQELTGMLFADEIVEALSIPQWLPGGIFDSFGEYSLTADLDEAAVPVVMVRRPFEHVDSACLVDEAAQPFADVVPVDQEHNPRAQVGEEPRERGLVRRIEGPGQEEVLAGRQSVAVTLFSALPGDVEPIEQALEEFQARVVDIRIGH